MRSALKLKQSQEKLRTELSPTFKITIKSHERTWSILFGSK